VAKGIEPLPSGQANAQNTWMKQFLAGLLVGMIAVSGWAKVVVPYSSELVKKAESGDAEALETQKPIYVAKAGARRGGD
jgi:flagellar biosynthesis/type III secretory pathway M-ring protein FliF/YscJ